MSADKHCPNCDSATLTRKGLPNLVYVHWVLNPGVAVNELLLGQRIPAEVYECASCDLLRYRRSWVHCPSCHTMHDAGTWTGRRAFGHWRGYQCPDCGGRIRCLWNLTSLILVAVTAPLWWPLFRVLRPRLDARAYDRAKRAKASFATRQQKKPNWILMGACFFVISWGISMAFIALRGTLTVDDILTTGFIWSIAAIGWTLTMYLILSGRAHSRKY